MKQKSTILITILLLTIFIVSIALADQQNSSTSNLKSQFSSNKNNYDIQWQINYGSDDSGGRYQGPQPIGDCDNDGGNELLLAGRDGKIQVMKWNKDTLTYDETGILHSPFYPLFRLREMLTGNPPPNAGGFAIGDITGDGENEIAATWYGAIYKMIGGEYRLIGFNTWIFGNGGGNGDCFIGDCDNDGQNELIMSGGGGLPTNPVPEIVILKWTGKQLEKVASYDFPGYGYAFMAGLGDPDNDGENEITVGFTNYQNGPNQYNEIMVLDWDKSANEFISTEIYSTKGWNEAPFGGWCADSDGDGIDEIHVGYVAPKISIFDWNGVGYELLYEKEWVGEGMLIEGLNVGDVDDDGIVEVCAGTDIIHILQWDGSTYIEEYVIDESYGDLAVVNIGDCDNDGKNEISVAPVFVDDGIDYIQWVFKYKEY
ncbi:MAG: hypothetical protein DRN27_06885 [Thermoplasmata archaeon]|nr:MAG: hypothetical protein DRN27_06885 [Thermoplasmata archaeon]